MKPKYNGPTPARPEWFKSQAGLLREEVPKSGWNIDRTFVLAALAAECMDGMSEAVHAEVNRLRTIARVTFSIEHPEVVAPLFGPKELELFKRFLANSNKDAQCFIEEIIDRCVMDGLKYREHDANIARNLMEHAANVASLPYHTSTALQRFRMIEIGDILEDFLAWINSGQKPS